MITIIDYGLGNVQAFANIYKRLNIPLKIVSSPEDLSATERIVLPGVGSFDWAITRLNESGMRERLDELVLEMKCPVLGICVGMQMMAKHSEEGDLPGLGWIDAEVLRFDESAFIQQTHLPHMGWNDVLPKSYDSLFRDLETGSRFYFLHSYYFDSGNDEDVLATTDYNGVFTSSVRCKNVFGVQFHPEKSHHWGILLLKNFAEM